MLTLLTVMLTLLTVLAFSNIINGYSTIINDYFNIINGYVTIINGNTIPFNRLNCRLPDGADNGSQPADSALQLNAASPGPPAVPPATRPPLSLDRQRALKPSDTHMPSNQVISCKTGYCTQ